MTAIGFMLFCGGVSGAIFLLIQLVSNQDRRVDQRLRELSGDDSWLDTLHAHGQRILDRTLGGVFQQYREVSANRESIEVRLPAAGIYSRNAVNLFLACRLALMIVPPLICLVLSCLGLVGWRVSLMVGGLLGIVAIALPGLWLNWQIAKRLRAISLSMSDFLDLCIVCLDGGLSLQATLRRVTDEMYVAHPTLAQEMTLVLRDVDMGITIGDAVRRFADRTGADFVRTFATFIRETQRFGTPLAEAMRDFAETLRTHAEHAAEERAQKAAVKILLPTLLLLFPAVFVVVVGPAAIQIYEAMTK